eukprot:18322-Heterococcus_DN1.PRE.2
MSSRVNTVDAAIDTCRACLKYYTTAVSNTYEATAHNNHKSEKELLCVKSKSLEKVLLQNLCAAAASSLLDVSGAAKSQFSVMPIYSITSFA